MDLLMRQVIFFVFVIASITLLFYAGFQVNWSKMLSPGPLSYAHEELNMKGDCNACHTKGKKLDVDKCLDCHQQIKGMIQKKSGLHANVTTECAGCHPEHHEKLFNMIHFNEKTFDHAMTGWPIGGKHALLRCEVCHTKDGYLLNKNKCFHCHEDIHQGENGKDCSECHTQNTFEDTK